MSLCSHERAVTPIFRKPPSGSKESSSFRLSTTSILSLFVSESGAIVGGSQTPVDPESSKAYPAGGMVISSQMSIVSCTISCVVLFWSVMARPDRNALAQAAARCGLEKLCPVNNQKTSFITTLKPKPDSSSSGYTQHLKIIPPYLHLTNRFRCGQSVLNREHGRHHARRHIKFAQDRLDMGFHRPFGNSQTIANPTVAQSFR